MKLEKILDNLNSFEKNSLLKIIDGIVSEKPKNNKEIEKILNDSSRDLKAMDNINIAKVFNLITDEFKEYIKQESLNATSQIGILTDIVIRDGNCIMKQDWFSRLYESEIKQLNKKVEAFRSLIKAEKSDLDPLRQRDYQIYNACVETAFNNDALNNQERKISPDEQTILTTLSQKLEFSNEEIKLINHMTIKVNQLPIDIVINDLKNLGVILYSKKTNMVYVADEIVTILRKIRGKEVGDKFFRRILRQMREPQINMICKKHAIDRKQDMDSKIKEIIKQGISFTGVLINDIHKEDTNLIEKKKYLNEFCDTKLKISPTIKGVTIEDKVKNLVAYFEEQEKDDKVGISIDGYDKLLRELNEIIPKINKIIKVEFELQDENVMKSNFLLDYNIKPRDVLELIAQDDLEKFCTKQQIKTRGDIVGNILEFYKDAENLYLENYESIGFRDLSRLKENGIIIKEADLGILFEDLTKKIFIELGFHVDEKIRKSINTSKDKIDILINMGNNELILIECKTIKENGYNKFSSVSRQIKSYIQLAENNNYKIIKSLLIAPDFSDEFVKDCGLDYELNLSLIAANSLSKIKNAFKVSKLKTFPHNLLMRDVLIQEERIISAIEK
ncbi:MAG: hypothetical protein ACK4ND_07760 [Cytophagaceae bacterium]